MEREAFTEQRERDERRAFDLPTRGHGRQCAWGDRRCPAELRSDVTSELSLRVYYCDAHDLTEASVATTVATDKRGKV